MSLVKCNECNNQFSDQVNYCPHCGAPINLIRYDVPELPNDLRLKDGFFSFLVSPEIKFYFADSLNKDVTSVSGKATVCVFSNGLRVNLPKSKEIDINFHQIVEIVRGKSTNLIEQNKSTIGRAVVGGLLLGGVGAIVGGISGIGKKQKEFEYFLKVTFYDCGSFKNLLLLSDKKHVQGKWESIDINYNKITSRVATEI